MEVVTRQCQAHPWPPLMLQVFTLNSWSISPTVVWSNLGPQWPMSACFKTRFCVMLSLMLSQIALPTRLVHWRRWQVPPLDASTPLRHPRDLLVAQPLPLPAVLQLLQLCVQRVLLLLRRLVDPQQLAPQSPRDVARTKLDSMSTRNPSVSVFFIRSSMFHSPAIGGKNLHSRKETSVIYSPFIFK